MMTIAGVDVFAKIIADARNDDAAPIKYAMAPAPNPALKMEKHFHPWSITPGEFDFIRDFIVAHNLRFGYECATAFGISGLAAAFGFKETKGKLVTMDAYVEEKYDHCFAYRDLKEVNSVDPDGLKSVKWLLEHFGLSDHVAPMVGWSPDNVVEAVRAGHGAGVHVDFAFIDAGHWDAAAIQDVTAIAPFIDRSKPYAVFFHDLACFSDALWNVTRELFGLELQPIETIEGGTWGMGVITNIAFK